MMNKEEIEEIVEFLYKEPEIKVFSKEEQIIRRKRMKIIGILNELYNNNKLENKRFKTLDGTILNNTEALLDYVGVSNNEWYSLTDLIETLQSEVEIIEEVEDKEYEDIEEIGNLLYIENQVESILHRKIDALIRNQKYILERLDK